MTLLLVSPPLLVVGGDSRFRLAISTMLMSLLAHLDWARRTIRGGFAVVSSADESCVAESFEMTFVAFAEIWVLDWMERRVISWVSERVESSKAIVW